MTNQSEPTKEQMKILSDEKIDEIYNETKQGNKETPADIIEEYGRVAREAERNMREHMVEELEKAKATMEKAEKEYRKACDLNKLWQKFREAYYAYQELLKGEG